MTSPYGESIWDGVLGDATGLSPDVTDPGAQQQAPPPDDAQGQGGDQGQQQAPPPEEPKPFTPSPYPGQQTQEEMARQGHANRVQAAQNRLGQMTQKHVAELVTNGIDEEQAKSIANEHAREQWGRFEDRLGFEQEIHNERTKGEAAAFFAEQYGMPISQLQRYETPEKMEMAAKSYVESQKATSDLQNENEGLKKRIEALEEGRNRQSAPPTEYNVPGTPGAMDERQELLAYGRYQVDKSPSVDRILSEGNLLTVQ